MTDNETFIVQSDSPDRLYVKTYHDFLDSTIINGKEKLIFILLKRYLNFKDDESGIEGTVYPTLDILSKQSGMTKKTVIGILKKLESKGLIFVKQQGLNKPNIYTLYDYSEIWKAGSSTEIENLKKNNFIDLSEVSTEVLLEEIKRRNKTKELESEPAKAQKQALELNQVNTIINSNKSQELERYSMQEIKEHFDYKTMINDRADEKESIDSVINIIYDVLNTRKTTVRINGEEKPAMSVQSKIMKLNYSEIMYCIDKFNEKTERIKNTTAYMLTLLYNAKERMHFDISNQVSHDMHK